ncbi:MAG: outer membrane protein assembly factor BamE [Gammaproteobacteria bacterium]|nr:outer membrane protein assembly factor BamE [Gammaproteobacteria bacterium]
MRFILIALLAFAASGCVVVYRLPTRQGNVIEQSKLDQLKLGMTHEQVQYLLGTPLAASPFDTHRWDYVGYYRSPRGQVSERQVRLYFDGDKLIRIEHSQLNADDKVLELSPPDTKTLSEEAKQNKAQDSGAAGAAGDNGDSNPP